MAPRCKATARKPRASLGKKPKRTSSMSPALSPNSAKPEDLKSALRQPSISSVESSPKSVRFTNTERGRGSLLTPPRTSPNTSISSPPRRNSSRQRMRISSAEATVLTPPQTPTQKNGSPTRHTSPQTGFITTSDESIAAMDSLSGPKIARPIDTKNPPNASDSSNPTQAASAQKLLEERSPPSTTAPDGTNVVIPDGVIDALAKQLEITPTALSLESIHLMFYWLQKSLRRWGKAYFKFELTEAGIAAFPLGELPSLHPEFFRVTQYIADGSQYTWRNFLTSKDIRHHLVYAIVSEFFKHHIFAATCCGLSDDENKKLDQIDILYLNWDGFVRTKERAKLLASILRVKSLKDREADLKRSVEAFISILMIVLEPVLPKCSKQRTKLATELDRLTRMAVALHQCIRLSGADGTVLSFRSSKKGDVFVPSARQNCVNKDFVRATESHAPNPDDKIVIKAACFPLVSAVVPYGPDLKDYVDAQLAHNTQWQETDPIEVEVVDAVHEKLWHDIPTELQEDPRRVAFNPRRPPPNPKRGSYVKTYNLNVADVYCEWTPLTERSTLAPEYRLTLQQAVQQAWAEKHAADTVLTKWISRAPLVLKLGASGAALAALAAAVVKHRHGDVDFAELLTANVNIPRGSDLLDALKTYLLIGGNTRRHIAYAARVARRRAVSATKSLFGGAAAAAAGAPVSVVARPSRVSTVLRPLTATAKVHKVDVSTRRSA